MQLPTADAQVTPYISEVRTFAGTFCPVGWALANGAVLQIRSYNTLFTLLGTK